VAQYENFECLSEEVVQALQQEYNEFTEVLKGLLFAIPRRPKALRSDRLLLERLAEREQKIETDLNELIIEDLRACDVSNENVMLGKNWLKLDWLAAASFAFRCRLGPKRREKPKSLKFFENFLPGLTAKKMSSPTLRRQIRRTIIELLSHKFFSKYQNDSGKKNGIARISKSACSIGTSSLSNSRR
jgi:hypothetical protein